MKANLEALENTPIKMLAKYLVTKGVQSGSRLQRLLFICRWVEIVNQQTTNSAFATNHNFQAWINGPVNTEVYYYLRPMFIEIDEKDHYLLSQKNKKDKEEMEKIDQKYKKFFEKWNVYSDDDLIDISHTNKAWINARKDIGPNEPCTNYLDEESPEFLKMNTNY